jgi:hypothetical protein
VDGRLPVEAVLLVDAGERPHQVGTSSARPASRSWAAAAASTAR